MSIAALLWPEFAVVKGCVFLKQALRPSIEAVFPSRTEFDENHVHLLDYFNHGAHLRREPFFDSRRRDFIAASNLGRMLCFMWAHELRQDFPRWHFRVYFHGFEPIVRFHRIRGREEPIMRERDWKKEIRSGEILILDTRKQA